MFSVLAQQALRVLGQSCIMLMWYGDPSNLDTVLHRTLVDFTSAEDLVAACSTEYLAPWSWATQQQICKRLRLIAGLQWAWCRSQPRDGVTLRNRRCTTCGWLTQRHCEDVEQCYECFSTSVCKQCTYRVPNDRVPASDRVDSDSAMQQRCLQCDLLPDVQSITLQQRNLYDFVDNMYDKFDASFCFGEHYRPNTFGRPYFDNEKGWQFVD